MKMIPLTILLSSWPLGFGPVQVHCRACVLVILDYVVVRSHVLDIWLMHVIMPAALSDERFDWLVVIDVDLYTKPTHIWQLIEVLQHDRSVVMACSSSLQNTPDIFGHGLWSYYDSYALVDKNNWLGITGAFIPLRDLDDRAHWIVGRPVSVQSAFGGIAVLNMNIVRLQDLSWDGTHGCEHWIICQKDSTAGLVMACPQVNPLVLHEVPRLISLDYQQRRKRELKELWSKAIVYN